jgi:hypothetical protein
MATERMLTNTRGIKTCNMHSSGHRKRYENIKNNNFYFISNALTAYAINLFEHNIT